jgi:hypothetical protein
VLVFWTDKTYEPKFSDRFKVEFRFDHLNVLEWSEVVAVQLPSFSVETEQYSLLNRQIIYPKNIIWNTISITFVEEKSNTLINFLKKHYRMDDNKNLELLGYHDYKLDTTTSKNKSFSNEIRIKQLDANGNTLETWEIKNCHIRDFSFSALNYAESNLRTITMNLTYEWAYLGLGNEDAKQREI